MHRFQESNDSFSCTEAEMGIAVTIICYVLTRSGGSNLRLTVASAGGRGTMRYGTELGAKRLDGAGDFVLCNFLPMVLVGKSFFSANHVVQTSRNVAIDGCVLIGGDLICVVVRTESVFHKRLNLLLDFEW
jgi:hypothetical protein